VCVCEREGWTSSLDLGKSSSLSPSIDYRIYGRTDGLISVLMGLLPFLCSLHAYYNIVQYIRGWLSVCLPCGRGRDGLLLTLQVMKMMMTRIGVRIMPSGFALSFSLSAPPLCFPPIYSLSFACFSRFSHYDAN